MLLFLLAAPGIGGTLDSAFVLATEIADNLEAALEQFRGIAKDLEE